MADTLRPDSGLSSIPGIWRRHRGLAIAVFAGVLGVGLAVAAALPAIYRASATVLVDREQVPEAFVRSAVTGEVETRLRAISEEILSRARLQALAERFDLYPRLRHAASVDAVIDQMRRDIRLESKAVDQGGGKSSTVAFAVSYRGRDPETVAAVANALASFYIEENSRIRGRQAAGTAEFLRGQLADMKARLAEQERSVGQPPLPVESEFAALERLNNRLRLNGDRQLRAMDRRDRMTKEAAGGGAPAGAGASPEGTAARLAKLRQDLAELRTHYTEKYPDVIRVRGEIAALERQAAAAPAAPEAPKPQAPAPAARAATGSLAEVDAELKTLQDEERGLRQQIATYEHRTEDAPRRQQAYQTQARDYATTKELYQSLLKRYEDAQIAESMEQGQRAERFRVVDQAVPPRQPVAPNRMALGLISVVAALGLGAGAMVLAERLDTSFHSAADLRAFTRVPVVADIPPLATPADRVQERRRGALIAATVTCGLALVVSGSYLFARSSEQITRMLAGGQ